MTRMELSNLKIGNMLHSPRIAIYCTVKEVLPLDGVLVEIDETREEVFVAAIEVLEELEVFV